MLLWAQLFRNGTTRICVINFGNHYTSKRNWKRLEGYATNKLGVIPLFLSQGTLLCARSRN